MKFMQSKFVPRLQDASFSVMFTSKVLQCTIWWLPSRRCFPKGAKMRDFALMTSCVHTCRRGCAMINRQSCTAVWRAKTKTSADPT